MTVRRTKGTLGGWRPGAGRPREIDEPARFTFDLERSHLAALGDLAAERGETVATVLRRLVRGYLKRSGRI